MSENSGIPHVDNVNNGNVDWSGYGGSSSDNALPVNTPREGSGNDRTVPFNKSQFSEFHTEQGSEDDIDFFNLPGFDESMLAVSPLPAIDTHNEISEPSCHRDGFQQQIDYSTDALCSDSGSFSLDDIPDIQEDGNHSDFANFNNHYIQHAPNNYYNTNLVNDGFVPGPGNSANSNINQMNSCSAPNASAISTFPPPTGSISNNASMQNLSYLGINEPGGLKEVDELARYSMEQVDTNSCGWNPPIFSSNLLDWGWIPKHRTPATSGRCQSCQLLRRIIHSNAVQDSKLEIHGLQGEPLHAVSECRLCLDDGKEGGLSCEIIEFPTRNPEHVKQFIAQYNHVRRNEGSLLRYDSFLLTTDVGNRAKKQTSGYWNWNMNARGNESSGNGMNSNVQGSSSATYIPKTAYSAQRQRTRHIKMSELARYFHIPIVEAASKLRVCPTVMKKICRKNGLNRWPHRKIKSIERQIQSLEISMRGETEEGREDIRNQIVVLRNKQQSFYGGFLVQTK